MPQAFRSLRWPILGLTAFVCAGIAIFLFAYIGAVAATGIEALAISLASGAAGYWLLRSTRLTLLAAVVPLVTAVLTLGIITSVATVFPALCGVIIPHAVATVLLIAGGAGLLMLHRFSAEQCAGNVPDASAASALAQVRGSTVMALAGATIWRVLLLLPSRTAISTDVTLLAAVVTALCAALVIFVLLPLASGAVAFDEAFVAKANRLREARAQMLDFLKLAVVPRWALAFIGIAVVFGALAFFSGTSPAGLWRGQDVIFPVTMILAGLIAVVGARDWRAFFGSALPAIFVAVLGAVWCQRSITIAAGNLATLSWLGGAQLLPVTAALAAAASYPVIARIAAYRRFEDPLDIAFERALGDTAMPIAGLGIALAVVLIPAHLWLLPLLLVVSALVLTPAVIAAIEILFPRLRSVEELYGRG